MKLTSRIEKKIAILMKKRYIVVGALGVFYNIPARYVDFDVVIYNAGFVLYNLSTLQDVIFIRQTENLISAIDEINAINNNVRLPIDDTTGNRASVAIIEGIIKKYWLTEN